MCALNTFALAFGLCGMYGNNNNSENETNSRACVIIVCRQRATQCITHTHTHTQETYVFLLEHDFFDLLFFYAAIVLNSIQ